MTIRKEDQTFLFPLGLLAIMGALYAMPNPEWRPVGYFVGGLGIASILVAFTIAQPEEKRDGGTFLSHDGLYDEATGKEL